MPRPFLALGLAVGLATLLSPCACQGTAPVSSTTPLICEMCSLVASDE